jgi:hypothetical protein
MNTRFMSSRSVPGSRTLRVGPSDTFDVVSAGTPEVPRHGPTDCAGSAAVKLLLEELRLSPDGPEEPRKLRACAEKDRHYRDHHRESGDSCVTLCWAMNT